jgi:hypothetical protein
MRNPRFERSVTVRRSFYHAVIFIGICGSPLTRALAQSNLPVIYIASAAVRTSLSKSTIPVLIPRQLPSASASDPLNLQVLSLTRNGYRLVLAHDDNPCEGQSVCAYGTLEANTAPINNSDLLPRRVQLRHGRDGKFVRSVCSTSCTEAYITWRQGQFFYSIGIKAGSRRELIDAANSAIAVSFTATEP